jgi:uncharacterized protein (TIGR03067 family)
MNGQAVLVLTAGLLLGADRPRPALRAELQRLQGEWQLVYAEVDGQAVPADSYQGERSVIRGDQLTVIKAGEVLGRATVAFDPTTEPKTFVETIAEGAYKGQKFHGIYELEGDTLRSCAASADRERPRDFTTRSGEKLFVSQRVKPRRATRAPGR